MNSTDRKPLYFPYVWTVVSLGSCAVTYAGMRLTLSKNGLPFLLLAAVTIAVASRVVVRFFRFDCSISASDIFIFLTFFLFGSEAAILLGAAESFYSSIRVTKKPLTMLFNAAAMACSTFLTGALLRVGFGDVTELGHETISLVTLTATLLMALWQYVFNSGIVAAAAAFWRGKPILATWKKHYVWTSITYFAASFAALITVRLIDSVGFYAFITMAPVLAIVYFTYLTYVKNTESVAAKAESERRFHQAFDNAPIGMALVSLDGKWLQVNHSLCQIVGFSNEELLGLPYQYIIHPSDLEKLQAGIAQVLEGRIPSHEVETRYLHKNGQEVWAFVGISRLGGAEGDSSQLIFQIQDFTARKQAEERLLYDAYHDALTGLPNRAWFTEQLRKCLKHTAPNDKFFGILFLDLDRFKIINDSIGHLFGDQLLIGIAERLRKCVRPGDSVARLGGDEFTVLVNGIRSVKELTDIAERLQEEISQPFSLSGYQTFTTASIGIAVSKDRYTIPEELLRDADTAMYQAKSRGKAQYVIFDKGMHVRALNLLQLETDLRRAIEREEFAVQYQPIVSLQNGELSGFEALVRWHHPERGAIPPDQFITVAEETGLIVPIGKWVLAEACQQMKKWDVQFPESSSLKMSVNISSRQFAQANLLEQIIQTLRTAKIDPQRLKLEITESVVMENIDMASQMLKRLRSFGIELSIDDFGTGYSSLSYLHRLPINTLKIDRSFVSQMSENVENIEIVRTIIILAQNLGLDVIAEGVETGEQVKLLRELKCESAQGYFFSRPVDAKTASRLIQARSRASVSENWLENTYADGKEFSFVSSYPM